MILQLDQTRQDTNKNEKKTKMKRKAFSFKNQKNIKNPKKKATSKGEKGRPHTVCKTSLISKSKNRDLYIYIYTLVQRRIRLPKTNNEVFNTEIPEERKEGEGKKIGIPDVKKGDKKVGK